MPVPSIDRDHDNISTPVTPDHRFRNRPLRNNSAKVSRQHHAAPAPPNNAYAPPCPHNGSTNYPNPRPTTPPPKPLESSPAPPSPSGLANIRIRRPQHGSLLLRSPARAGHAARMRQIFEHASLEQQPPQPSQPLLYPQLPNVSRKASPPLAQPSHVGNHSRCMSTASSPTGRPHVQPTIAGVSEQSSESWSDDSGYLVLGSRTLKLARAFIPDNRISEWLAGVSTPDCDDHDAHVQEHDAHVGLEPCEDLSAESSDTASSRIVQRPLEPRPAKAMIQDVFCGKDRTYTRSDSVPSKPRSPLKELIADYPSTNCPPRPTTPLHSYHHDASNQPLSSNDEIQLSPLSPNVCIERGPSRYHSSRSTQYVNRALPARIPCTPSRENIAPPRTSHPADSPLVSQAAPCKVGVGTRFQHPRHTPAQKQGRWARNVQP